jgi:capsular exopolysaccharide synthesis family protein
VEKEKNMHKIFFVDEDNIEVTEALRTLRTNLSFLDDKEKGRTILFSSSIPAEGKSFVAANYAASVAIADKKVLLIDCDIRRPRAHESFGIKVQKGLESVLTNNAPVDEVIIKDIMPNLDLLPTKHMKNNVTELFVRDRMKTILEEIKNNYDVVVLDTPPIAVASDAVILSKNVDGVVIVIGYDQVAKRELEFTKEMFTNAGANLYGFVVNGVDKTGLSYGNYGYYNNYYTYYEDYYMDDDNHKVRKKVKTPKNKIKRFIYNIKSAYIKHFSGDIRKRR